jgi:hypothetical protein
VGKLVRLAAEPFGARTLVPITNPREVLAVSADVAAVPPCAKDKGVVSPEIEIPVIFLLSSTTVVPPTLIAIFAP